MSDKYVSGVDDARSYLFVQHRIKISEIKLKFKEGFVMAFMRIQLLIRVRRKRVTNIYRCKFSDTRLIFEHCNCWVDTCWQHKRSRTSQCKTDPIIDKLEMCTFLVTYQITFRTRKQYIKMGKFKTHLTTKVEFSAMLMIGKVDKSIYFKIDLRYVKCMRSLKMFRNGNFQKVLVV